MIDCWHCKYYHAEGLWNFCDVFQKEYFAERLNCKKGKSKTNKRIIKGVKQ